MLKYLIQNLVTIPFILVFWSICDLHGSDKPGESGKPGDMINILKSQGEPGKVREKISKILQVMEESGRFFLIKLINLFLGCFF